MSMGPIIIFDKSALQSLSVDESCWLDNFFLNNITPLFYVETLADLEKKSAGNTTPEQIVGNLAAKTPSAVYPNVHYQTLVIYDLHGYKTEMSNRPIIDGGETKISPEGKVGVHFEQFPEAEVMNRWQKGQFWSIERDFAKEWRRNLSNLSFEYYIGLVKNIVPNGVKFSNLRDVKNFVDSFVKGKDKEILLLTFEVLGIPDKYRSSIVKRWSKANNPVFEEFAPYAAFVLKVDLLFYLSLDKSFISKERPSNKIDVAYLYYLPFCMIFVSKDKLHARVAPLFMELGQTFVNGNEFKEDMKILDDYYSNLSEELKLQGIMKFAVYPPEDIDNLTAKLWDKFLPIWRKHSEQKRKEKKDPEESRKLVQHLNHVEKESQPFQSTPSITADEADHVMFKRTMPLRKGKWRLLPPEVEEEMKNRNNS